MTDTPPLGEQYVIELIENEADFTDAVSLFVGVPFNPNLGNELSDAQLEDHYLALNRIQVELVLCGHYLDEQGPTAAIAHALTKAAEVLWLTAYSVASAAPDLRQAAAG